MCMFDYSDPPEFFVSQTHTARKEHECVECRRTIKKGERYHTDSGKWDGQFAYFKTCGQCNAATQFLEKVCDGYLIGSVYDDLEEHIGGYHGDPLVGPLPRLVAMMRRDWKFLREDGLLDVSAVRELTKQAIAAAT